VICRWLGYGHPLPGCLVPQPGGCFARHRWALPLEALPTAHPAPEGAVICRWLGYGHPLPGCLVPQPGGHRHHPLGLVHLTTVGGCVRPRLCRPLAQPPKVLRSASGSATRFHSRSAPRPASPTSTRSHQTLARPPERGRVCFRVNLAVPTPHGVGRSASRHPASSAPEEAGSAWLQPQPRPSLGRGFALHDLSPHPRAE
jgi:hypothetical protein